MDINVTQRVARNDVYIEMEAAIRDILTDSEVTCRYDVLVWEGTVGG